MTDAVTMLTLTRIEAEHLRELVQQFSDLVAQSESDDPALSRLTPPAYSDDDEAAAEFASLTRRDLLERRARDAAVVIRDLERVEPADVSAALSSVDIVIGAGLLDSWLRTLAAVRLVLASRLGIEEAAEHDEDDPAFALYDWLGYRFDGLLRAAEARDDA